MTIRRISEPHVEAEFGVEVAEGFVEEEALGADGEGAGEGYALLLAAGKLIGAAVLEMIHLDEGEGFGDALVALGVLDFANAQAEGDIFGDGHMGPEGVALEDHAGVTAVGGHEGDIFGIEEDSAGGWEREAGDHAEEGGFAAAGGAQEEEEVAGGNFERNGIDSGGGPPCLRGAAKSLVRLSMSMATMVRRIRKGSWRCKLTEMGVVRKLQGSPDSDIGHLERCPSGLRNTTGNRVYMMSVPRVRIPLSPF